MFFDHWNDLARVLIVGALAYVALLIFLRVSGKRTLAKLNAFDLVITVALGSCLATVILSKEVAYVEGIAAFALLAFLQFAITWLSLRTKVIKNMVRSEPRMLVVDGQFQHQALRVERVTEDEVFQCIRQKGFGSLENIAAVILETDGSMSVISDSKLGSSTALQNVRGH